MQGASVSESILQQFPLCKLCVQHTQVIKSPRNMPWIPHYDTFTLRSKSVLLVLLYYLIRSAINIPQIPVTGSSMFCVIEILENGMPLNMTTSIRHTNRNKYTIYDCVLYLSCLIQIRFSIDSQFSWFSPNHPINFRKCSKHVLIFEKNEISKKSSKIFNISVKSRLF